MSSSLVYFLVVEIKDTMPWWILMILIYIINIVLAFLLAKALKYIDSVGWEILELVRKKTASV
jgi:hypothetical protein